MTLVESLLVGAVSGWLVASVEVRLTRILASRRYELRAGRRRWASDAATRDEENLARRIGQPAPQDIGSDPARYAAWRRTLVLGAAQRLFDDLGLRGQSQGEARALIFRHLSVGQRRLVVSGVIQHLLQPLLRQIGQQGPNEAAQRDHLIQVDLPGVVAIDHVSSSGLQPGCEPAAAAGARPSSPSTGAAA